jgi:hypothetical protein
MTNDMGHGFSQIYADKNIKDERFERLTLFVISTKGRNLNNSTH